MKTNNIEKHITDIHFLQKAIGHGRRSIGITWPNPPVGCVIVKKNKIVGRGSTGENGIPHAEINALNQAGENSNDSDLYCSLEPCSHQGKTPPCVNKIIKKNISRVIIPILDPNPIVKGNGISILKKAGIKVIIIDELREKAYELIKGFDYLIQKKRPFITLKIATSLDGMIATKNGNSKWISNSFSRERVQYLRFINDAILVGTNTANKDKPSLGIRNGLKIYKQPKKFFIDTNLILNPKNLNFLPDYIFHSSKLDLQKKLKWKGSKTELIEISNINNTLDVMDIIKKFHEMKINNLLIEGGGKLASTFLKEDLVDKVVHYGTGLIIGSNGTPSISEIFQNCNNINDFPRLNLKSVRNINGDVETIWERNTRD